MPILSAAWRGVSRVEEVRSYRSTPSPVLYTLSLQDRSRIGDLRENPVIAVTRQWPIRMIAFRWHSPKWFKGRVIRGRL
jgi:hypothetical protein